jgi:allantoate deiminase
MQDPAAQLATEVLERCETLARYSETPGQLTRSFLSLPFKDVHRDVGNWMAAAGLTVHTDAIGNLIGRSRAPRSDAPIFIIGSHLDTVRNAGKYDGVLGVLVGIAVCELLRQETLPFQLEVVGFSDEEGVRFGATYFGSQALTGTFPIEQLMLTDQNGVSLRDAIMTYGLNPDDIPRAAHPPKQVMGYAEVHIEQGPVLESLNAPIGIAEAIIGQSKLELTFFGKAGHAGTTPMHLRQDALVAAAAFVTAVAAVATAQPGLVATVGRLECLPGASNVIPGEVRLTLDVRHKDDARRETVVRQLLETARQLAAEHQLTVQSRTVLSEATSWMSRAYTERLLTLSGAPSLVSGAGHDASVMSRFTQSALIFVRSPGGVSHHPDEAVMPGDVAVAISTLANFLRHLAVADA